MNYLILLTLIPAIWAAAYAITVPVKVQNMLDIGDDFSPEEFLESLGILEKAYLLFSATPFLLAPLLFISDFERGKTYCAIMVLLAILGIVLRTQFVKKKRFLIIESTVELVIYCDVFRSGLLTIWG